MASLYLHIPFCKSRCIYCDFYSGTDTSQRASYVQALCDELKLRSTYLPTRVLDSIYFGGGTPSLLQKTDFERLFEAIRHEGRIRSSISADGLIAVPCADKPDRAGGGVQYGARNRSPHRRCRPLRG